MKQTIYSYVMHELGRTELTLREVAEGADVPYSTLTRIARGDTKNASVHVFDKLALFFRSSRRRRKAG